MEESNINWPAETNVSEIVELEETEETEKIRLTRMYDREKKN